MNTLKQLMTYEAGELSGDDTIDLFQEMVNTGLAWTLQGSYGRAARALIDAGIITEPTTEEN